MPKTPVTFQNIEKLAAANRNENNLFFKKIKKLDAQKLDALFHETHENIFDDFDCLACANCCRSLGPRITEADILRIAKQRKMKPAAFISTYLCKDEEDDFVFQTMPCPFLDTENYCTIYDSRPKACREYPHTDRRRMHQILNLTFTNCNTCPAVFLIIERLKALVK